MHLFIICLLYVTIIGLFAVCVFTLKIWKHASHFSVLIFILKSCILCRLYCPATFHLDDYIRFGAEGRLFRPAVGRSVHDSVHRGIMR